LGIAVAAIVTAAAAPPAAGAATCNYTAAMPGSWQNPLNWDCPGGPTAADDVVLGTGDSVTLSADAAAASLSVNGATLAFGTSKLDVAGATVLGSGTLTGAGRLNAAGGIVKNTAGQVSLTGGVTVAPTADSTWSGGEFCLQNASTLRIQNALDIAAGAGSFNCSSGDSLVQFTATSLVTVAGTRTWFSQVDNDGTVSLTGGTLTVAAASPNTDAGSWSIAASAGLTISADRTVAAVGGAGTLLVNSGTTTVPNGATLNPAVLTVAGGIVNVDGTAPALSLPQVNLTGGTLGGTRSRTITSLAAQSGTMTGAATTTVTGSFVKSTTNQLTITGATTIRPTVDTTWNAGSICITNASTLRLEHALAIAAGAGSFNCSSNDSLVHVTATGSIDVTGGTHTWFSRLDNDGLVTVDTGTLGLSAAAANTDAGAWTIAAPAQLTISADRTVASVGGPGTLLVNSGTLTVPDGGTLSPTVLQAVGGTVNVDGTQPATSLVQVELQGGTLGGTRNRTINSLAVANGTLAGPATTTVTGAFAKTSANQLTLTGGVTVRAGTSAWDEGSICITTGSTLQVAGALAIAAGAGLFNCSSADSLVDVVGGGSVSVSGPPRTWFSRIRNGGTFTLGPDQTVTFAGGLQNVAGGTLTGTGTAAGTITNAGGLISPGAGTFTFPDPLIQTAGQIDVGTGETLANGKELALSGGTLTGSGTVSGDVANTAATVRPGRLTIAGKYTQAAGGALETDINSTTDFGQVLVGGAASLAGTLAIVRAPSFNPPSGTKFQVVSSATRTGTFTTLTGATFGPKSFADDGSTPGFRLVVLGPDAPTPGTPTISGDHTLTCNEGTWTGSPTFTYEWLRDGVAVGAGKAYDIAPADAGHELRCRVTGTNAGGSVSATSAPVLVPAATPSPTPTPTTTPTPIPTVSPTPSPTPIPTPTPKPPLTGATPQQIATAFGLPASSGCVRRASFKLRIREPKGIKIKSAKVLVDGKPVRIRNRTATIDVRKLHRHTFTVTIRITTTDKRTLTGKRTYKVCR
jgi:hypothetical protein